MEALSDKLSEKCGRAVSRNRIGNQNGRYSSFKVSAECHDVGEMYNPELWPDGAFGRRYYELRRAGATVTNAVLAAELRSASAGTGSNHKIPHMTGPLHVLSYNCQGLHLSQSADARLAASLLTTCWQTLCLQRDVIHGAGESTTDYSSGIIRGRIPGWVAIMWSKRLDLCIDVLRLDVHWCIGVQFSHNGREFIILNVYTPFECTQNEDENLNRLAFIQSSSTSCIYVIGNMNADIADRGSLFANHTTQFCQENNLMLSSKELLPADSFTYISKACHTASWLDHCISTADAHTSIMGMNINL